MALLLRAKSPGPLEAAPLSFCMECCCGFIMPPPPAPPPPLTALFEMSPSTLLFLGLPAVVPAPACLPAGSTMEFSEKPPGVLISRSGCLPAAPAFLADGIPSSPALVPSMTFTSLGRRAMAAAACSVRRAVRGLCSRLPGRVAAKPIFFCVTVDARE
jgi:hypothetical protein